MIPQLSWIHLENSPLSWNYSLKEKELGYMRKDFDPDQLRLLLIFFDPKRTIGLVGVNNCEWIIRAISFGKKFHRRDLNLRPTDPEGGRPTLSTQPLSYRVETVLWVPCP